MPKISALPAASSVNLTDILPEVSPAIGGTTYQATFTQVFTAFKAAGTALTEVSDTNVTLTLGGSPSTALLNATSITAGWSGQLAVSRGGTAVSSVTTTPTATNFAGWDANKNLSGNNLIEGYTTTATSATITTLTVGSTNLQYFTGSTTQTVVLPVVTTLVLGFQFQITNLSSGVVTVESSGGNTVQAMIANSKIIVTCVAITGTTAASWDVHYTNITGEGTVTSVAATVPSVLSISGSPITTNGTLAIGYSGTALPIANGGTAATTASITSFNNITGYSASGATGTTSTNLVFSTSPTFITPVLGAATATSLTFSPTTDGIVGTTTNDSASTGYVGEYVASSVVGPIAFTTTATYQNMASIALGAGDWDVFYTALLTQGAAGVASFYVGGVSSVSLTFNNVGGLSNFYQAIIPANDVRSVSGTVRISLASSGNAYLVGQATWASGTVPTFYCQIAARRVR